MKMPLFLRWLAHAIKSEWLDWSDDTQIGCMLFFWVVSIADIISLLFVNSQWTRESGYGWVQGLYNWAMFFFWFTDLPFLLMLTYILIKATLSLYESAKTSYEKYKRDNA